MEELKIFENPDFGQVRTISKDGEPWFVLVDVCRVLELKNRQDALSRLDDDEHAIVSTDVSQGRSESLNCVNESGLYALVLGSRKPEARAFKRWITHEVIPAIRKTGGYIAGEEHLSDDELMAKALLMAGEKIRQRDERIAHLAVENSRLTVDNQIMAPKAEYFDEMVDRNLLTNFRDTAKALFCPPKKFVTFLLEHKYIFRDVKGKLQPYANAVEMGYLVIKECFNQKTDWAGTQTMVTPKGREAFRLLLA